MKSLFLLPFFIFPAVVLPAQSVAINTDGTVASDSTAMLEIKKNKKSKLKIRTTGFNDTAQIELSNLLGTAGTSMLMSLNREEGLLFSSSSDLSSRNLDSIFSMRFNVNKVFFGMNVKTPSAALQIHDPSSSITSLRLTNSTTGSVGTNGLLLSINGINASLVNTEAGTLGFGTSNFVYGGFNSTGNFGVGSVGATEKLGVTGNIVLTGSGKGIILDAQDRPLITRGFDAFTSGNYTGLGRWGLFMEPSRLTLGIPDLAGKGIELAKYATNSSRTTLLQVSGDDASVKRPAQNSVDLLPVCVGSIDGLGNIRGGSGNFTTAKDTGSGATDITIAGVTYDPFNYTVLVTGIPANGERIFATAANNGGKIRVFTYFDSGVATNVPFSIVVYKLN